MTTTHADVAALSGTVGHRWLQRCRDAVATPQQCRALRAELDDENSPIHQALQYESESQWLREPRPDANGELPTPELAAARVLLGLVEALVGQRDPQAAVASALRHFDAVELACAGTQLLGGEFAATADPGPLGVMLRAALTSGAHPSRGFVMLMLLELVAQRPGGARRTQMPVLFATSDQRGQVGEFGRLVVEVLTDGPSGIHPDPAVMAFSQLGRETWIGIEKAWAASDLASTGACVVWSVSTEGVPSSSIEGDSMSAAFAVCLDEVAPKSRLRRALRLRALDHDCAVTAGLDGNMLTSVLGYPEKLTIARAQSLRVVVAERALPEARGAAAPDFVERVSGAATIAEAIDATRSVRNRSLWIAVAALVMVVALAIGGGVAGFHYYQQADRERLATELAAKSSDFANSDSRLSALLALTADRVHSSPTTLAAMRTVADNNESVVASAQVADSAVDYVASFGRVALTAGTSEATRKTLRAWTLPALTPLGDIQLGGSVRGLGGAGYSGSGMIAALVDAKLQIFQGTDERVPVRVASFDTPFTDNNTRVFGPFVDADTNAVVAFDEQRRGVFWAPGMPTADTFDLSADIGNTAVVAVSGFGALDGFDATEQQNADTSGHTVLLATSDRSVHKLIIDRTKSRASANLATTTKYYASPADTVRTYRSSSMLTSSIGAQIFSIAISSTGSVLVGTDTGLRQFYRDSDEADIDKAVKERVTGIVIPSKFSDSVIFFSARGLGIATEGTVTQLARVDSAQAVTRTIRSLAQNTDGTVLTGRTDGSVVLADPSSSLTRLPKLYGATDIRFADTGELVRAGVNGKGSTGFGAVEVSTVSSKTEAELALLRDGASSSGTVDRSASYRREGKRYSVAFSVDATSKYAVVVGNNFGSVWLWDRGTDDPSDVTRTFYFERPAPSGSNTPDSGRGVALSPDSTTLYAFNPGRGEFTAWSTADGSVKWTKNLAMTTDGQGVAVAKVSFDRARTRALLNYFSPDGDRRHVLIDLRDGAVRDLDFLSKYDDTLLSPGGDRIVASADNSVATFEVGGHIVAAPMNLGGTVGKIAWSPDQQRLVIDRYGTGQLMFVSASTLEEVAPRWRLSGLGPNDYVNKIVWSPNGKFLAINIATSVQSGLFGTKSVYVLKTDTINMTSALCAIAGSELTAAEWRRLVGDINQFTVCEAKK